MVKIGALWQKQDKNGNIMFSGEYECPHCQKKSRILGFFNKYKKPENRQPNFNLFAPDEQPQEEAKDEPYIPEGDEKSKSEGDLPF